jgi:alginate O-acetyltransferase complex protein AlgJ
MMLDRIFNGITALGFVALASAPLLHFSPAPWSDPLENRNSAAAPAYPENWGDAMAFTPAFEAYFNDHFGFRQQLINFRNRTDFWVFHRSPTEQVLIGRDNWLFFTGAESVEDYMGKVTISDQALESWYLALKQRRDWLASQGIDYHFVFEPNKQSVYPEYMPHSVVRGAPTQKDQLIAYLAKRGEPSLVEDMRPPLYQAKDDLFLYHPLDSHWNPYGGYLGYHALVENLSRNNPAEVRPLSLSKDVFKAEETQLGDLSIMMKFKRYPFKTADATYAGPPLICGQPVAPSLISTINPRARDNIVECAKVDPAARAMFFNDSMIEAMQPYLGESFSHLRFTRMFPTFSDIQAYVRAEHPKVVVEERMERNILLVPERPPMATATLSDAIPPKTRSGAMEITDEPDGDVVISGFSTWLPTQAGANLKINTNLAVDDLSLELRDSSDVVAALQDSRLGRSRFVLRLFLKHDQPRPQAIRLCLWTEDPVYGSVRPFFNTQAEWDSCPGQ